MPNPFTSKKILIAVSLMLVMCGIVLTFHFLSPHSQKISFPGATPQKGTSSEIITDCTPKFSHHFTDVDTIDSIVPPVFRNREGTMPTTLINTMGKTPLYMPTAGKLTQGAYYTEQGTEFYMWEVDVGCGITITFDHVTEPVEKIRMMFSDTLKNDSRTAFFEAPLKLEAGELVGHTTGSVNSHNWNFAVYDVREKNFLWGASTFSDMPKYYMQVCPFKYYEGQMAAPYEDLFVLSFNEITVEKNLCGHK